MSVKYQLASSLQQLHQNFACTAHEGPLSKNPSSLATLTSITFYYVFLTM